VDNVGAMQRVYTITPRVEAGSNSSTVALWVVGGDEKEPSAWWYNWATLFLGVINTGTWLSRLGKPQIWESKIWSRVPRDSDPRMTALVRTSSNRRQQTSSLVRDSAPHQQTRKCLSVTKVWSYAPDGCLTPRQTGQLTVGRNITLTLTPAVQQLRREDRTRPLIRLVRSAVQCSVTCTCTLFKRRLWE
jgi:hypothetical protein